MPAPIRALSVYMGREAADRIGRDGWSADLFDLLLGASGGPKWFILGHLDRLLFGHFLTSGTRPLTVVGSSIGSWRHACLAMEDPVSAVDRLEQGYLYQHYATAPTADEVSEVSLAMLDKVLGDNGARALAGHPRFRSHIVTARGRGPAAAASSPLLATGMGVAALGNAVSRRLLKLHIVYRIILDQVYLGGYSFTKFHQSPNVLRLIVDALPDHIFVGDRSFGLLVPVFQRIHQIC